MKVLEKILNYVFMFVRGAIFGIGIVAGAAFIMICMMAIKYWIWG